MATATIFKFGMSLLLIRLIIQLLGTPILNPNLEQHQKAKFAYTVTNQPTASLFILFH